jgi:hypothetical protein
VDVDLDDKKILEGMSRVALTSDDMAESIFQGDEFRTAQDLDPVTTINLGIEDILIPYKQHLFSFCYLWQFSRRLCDIDNRYERMSDLDSFMNERCFSAGYPCRRYSSIPGKRFRGGWIGTQLSTQLPTQLPTQLYSYIRTQHELAVYVFYLEAYD